MWIYIKGKGKYWEVGSVVDDPDRPETKFWVCESQWIEKEDAARRVHYLNGGSGYAYPIFNLDDPNS